MSELSVPLYNVNVLVEYYTDTTVVYSETVPLALPALLPEQANGFYAGGPGIGSNVWGVRAQVVGWSTQASGTYYSLTMLSAEIKRSKFGDYDCIGVSGFVRNDNPFALKDIQMLAIATVPEPTETWRAGWVYDAIGALRTMDNSTVTTTIQAGETLPYGVSPGCAVSWSSQSIVEIVTQGIANP